MKWNDMKILLVYPSLIDETGQVIRYRKAYTPPLSLGIMAGLTPESHQVHVVNDMVEDIDFGVQYDLVALTAMTTQAPRAYQIAQRFRNQGVKVIIGGIHASMLPDEAKQFADAVVVGEVEEQWEQILIDVDRKSLQPVYQSNRHPSLERQILPKWDNFNLSIYRPAARSQKTRLPLYTTRGCLYNCSYCSVTSFFGQTYRHRPISNIVEEVSENHSDTYFIVDDNIVCEPDYTEELFKALSSRNIRWTSQASMQLNKHPKLIELAAKAGCTSLFLGIESINQNTLKSLRKGFNKPEEYIELFDRLERNNIRPLVSMIVGLDEDTQEDIENTLHFLAKNKVQSVYFHIYTPLPGTNLYKDMLKAGRIIDKDWSKYDLGHVVFDPANFSPEKLESTYWQTYGRFYAAGAIARRTLSAAMKYQRKPDKILRDLAFQIYMRAQTQNQQHPLAMGIGRIK